MSHTGPPFKIPIHLQFGAYNSDCLTLLHFIMTIVSTLNYFFNTTL